MFSFLKIDGECALKDAETITLTIVF